MKPIKCLLVSVLLCSALLLTPDPAAAGTVNTKSLHINMQGLISTNQTNRNHGKNYIIGALQNGGYISASLNEVCLRQVYDIYNALGGGWSFIYLPAYDAEPGYHSGDAGCNHPGLRPEYGNAVFVKNFGNSTDNTWHYYSTTDAGAYRNVVCLSNTFILLRYWSCSTHMSYPPTLEQRNEFLFTMAVHRANSNAMHAMGDLNQDRPWFLSFYYYGYKEADLNDPKRATGAGGGRIDYIFGRPESSVTANQWISSNLIWTDHRAIAGYFTSPT
jgi:hypothetical protein